jgi:hypothetical protein
MEQEHKNFSMLGLLVLLRKFFVDHLKKITSETLGWMAAIILHCATIPSMLALMTGLSDRAPSVDVVLFIWAGLMLLFARAVVLKDMLNVVTIGVGFMVQSVLMALILFK